MIILNKLEQLKKVTKIVADTGDFLQINKYKPEDATTNPSLLLKAVQMSEYEYLVDLALKEAEIIEEAMINISVYFGTEILKVVPGLVSTEVDARLSFDQEKTIKYARGIIDKYDSLGVDKSRVLIKIASTWEGIKAAEILEKDGIKCNLTLMFDICQAIACAQSSVYLVSPFVGRITDWYMNTDGSQKFPEIENDKGVISVKEIYTHYKKFGYTTVVMGASFRHVNQVESLSGCDALTISPALLSSLESDHSNLNIYLNEKNIDKSQMADKYITENDFRWAMNENQMATEKLSDGIRQFAKDTCELENIIRSKII